MTNLVLILAVVLLIGDRAAYAETCWGQCVKKDKCNVAGSANVVVLPTLPNQPTSSSLAIDLRLSEGCDRLETCCNDKDIIPDKPKKHVGFDQCGIRNLNGIGYRLVGEKVGFAEYGEFPWTLMVLKSLQVVDIYKDVYVCGASLIAPNLALTAAHCVIKYKDEQYHVRAGEWDTNTDKELFATQVRNVAEVLIHEKYNEYHHNNLALLRMDKPFEPDQNIQVICLPTENIIFTGQECFTGAWGKDKFEKGKLQNILRRVEVPVLPHGQCQDAFRSTRLGPAFELDQSYMCAGGEENVDVCTGDGGAPLACAAQDGSGRYLQAGIVAWGIGCGQKGVPGAYTDVTKFVSWIRSKMTALGADQSVSAYLL